MISDLSDCVLLHILSFLNTKEAVQTCILSKRRINLWKTLSTITLDCFDFEDYCFNHFLSQILSLRDHSTPICALRLSHPILVKNLFQNTIKYAVSHHLKHLQLNVSTIADFPSCFFSCLTLTSLYLTVDDDRTLFHPAKPVFFPNSLNLPALTTLSLEYFAFVPNDDGFVEPFSAFNTLNTLIVHSCVVLDGQNLRISSTKLVDLTIHMYRDWNRFPTGGVFGIELYYAPSLHSLTLTGYQIIHLLGSNIVLASIKHLNIEVHYLCSLGYQSLSILFNWLVELANIESLTTTSSTLKVFSSHLQLLKAKSPSFWNLKLLKIKTHTPPGEYSIPEGLRHLFLRNSPSAKVDIIQYQW